MRNTSKARALGSPNPPSIAGASATAKKKMSCCRSSLDSTEVSLTGLIDSGGGLVFIPDTH